MKYIITLIISLYLISCGGSVEQNSSMKVDKAEETTQEESATEEKEIIEITVLAKGETMTEIAFEPKSLEIPKNTRIKLTLKNESSTAGMLHNFVLVELGSGQEIATAGISAGEANNFVPKDKRVFANTTVLNIGEETIIEFDAPPVGSYHYICSFPGHYPNMIGRMNVQ